MTYFSHQPFSQPQRTKSTTQQNALGQRGRNVNFASERATGSLKKIPQNTMASCLIIVIIHQTPDVRREGEKKTLSFYD